MKVLLAWLVAVIPLGWGISKTIDKSKPLFTGDNAASSTPAKP
jgi:hypothetical protein